jgi:hypothetical protein
MSHNGIEYGLMQAYAEGFDIFKNAVSDQLPEDHRYDLNVADIAELWRRGSVVSSWLLDLTSIALAQDPKLEGYEGFVQDSGGGRWTVQAAVEEAVPAEVLTAALYTRVPVPASTTPLPRSSCRRCGSRVRRSRGTEVGPGAQRMVQKLETALTPQHNRTADPCLVVIFGASGDLTKRKLIPAILNLQNGGFLPRNLAVVGVARTPMTHAEFRDEVKPDDKAISSGPMRAAWAALSERIFYHSADATKPESFTGLGEFLRKTDAQVGTPGNYLFYLSVSPSSSRPSSRTWGSAAWRRRRTGAGGG